MIRDRGRIKWTAMMLPEHLAKLRDWVGEDDFEEKPDIDEWTLQEFQQQLAIAYQSNCEIRVKTWNIGVLANITGILTRIDEQARLIYITDGLTVQKILLNSIVGIETITTD
ncbi:YolD-like family protein [Sporosarcina beigongshangi]|uniref:YolD-like family protein n=1 Tax=Sporosarcina beigongshangi TaxID=2782538 RepID=UPI0019393C64|nr:YolD-like family protein [Sporosarcina beigongshangi]